MSRLGWTIQVNPRLRYSYWDWAGPRDLVWLYIMAQHWYDYKTISIFSIYSLRSKAAIYWNCELFTTMLNKIMIYIYWNCFRQGLNHYVCEPRSWTGWVLPQLQTFAKGCNVVWSKGQPPIIWPDLSQSRKILIESFLPDRKE